MNQMEKKYLRLLHKERAEGADIFERPSYREMWKGIVEKYSDQAHFIYELIQNADDAQADYVRFQLEPDRLIFAHNGKRHFSISNPEMEEIDSESGKLGDINAITGIAFSNKKENKIGKFGVGFKAVFQYTESPFIYDPNFRFRIERYIVPTELEDDFLDRKPEETLFVFPFNQRNRKAEESYRDIEEKLKTLHYPILFLTNLQSIFFEIGEFTGVYQKRLEESCLFDLGEERETAAEKLCLIQKMESKTEMKNVQSDTAVKEKHLWLFSRFDGEFKYSAGFFLDQKDGLIPVNEPAFCFFPTKETTGLHFIVHAPFLLTDSREGIRAGVDYNSKMIALLAELAADSLLYLRDIGIRTSKRLITDEIFSVIPIQKDLFCSIDEISRVSFLPFYREIRKKFQMEKLLPTRDGYTTRGNAYWAAVPFLTQLFGDAQLADLCKNPNAKWVFLSLGRDEVQRNNKDLFSYISELVKSWLGEDALISGRSRVAGNVIKEITGINKRFIEKQEIEWLHRFYKWLSETSHRTEIAQAKPIFLDQDGYAVEAFDEKKHLKLFLPVADMDITEYRMVHQKLLKNADTYNFIKKIGITEPSVHDQIYHVILPKYKDGEKIATDPHFLLFFQYYCECPQNKVEDFIKEIRDCKFLVYYTKSEKKTYRGRALDLYFPFEKLLNYFESKPDTRFIELERYKKLIKEKGGKEKDLLSFLEKLGVRKTVFIDLEKELSDEEISVRSDLPDPYFTQYCVYQEPEIEGCREIVALIVQDRLEEKSVVLWEQLLQIISFYCYFKSLESLLEGKCYYFYYSEHEESFLSSITVLLRTEKWLVNQNQEFVSAAELSLQTISDSYDLESKQAKELIRFLEIKEKECTEEEKEDNILSERQRRQIETAKLCDQLGLTIEDLKEMAEIKRGRENGYRFQNMDDSETAATQEEEEEREEDQNIIPKGKRYRKIVRVVGEIIKQTTFDSMAEENSSDNQEKDLDEDEWMPLPVDFKGKAESEKRKAAKTIDRIVRQEELQQRALDAEKYSYGWFLALLELEVLNSSANYLNSKEVSICFAKAERESGTKRTLILKQPNRYIPQFMEDLADIPLILDMEKQQKTFVIEAANVRSYTLRVKLKPSKELDQLDFSKVTAAYIEAKSPVFLLEELKRQFAELGYEQAYSMQANLCKNIEFIFGPPGTGKTTYLANNVIIPMMKRDQRVKILVLTPTNKAADVLTQRIIKEIGGDISYRNWLIRFGATGEEELEQSQVCREKTFDIRKLEKSVTITTIARFPYDFFMPQGTRIFLNGINWDYIVIDEASMIPIVNIIYPLYKKTPKKFIIAGDPFQIEPITSVNLWKNENIYTLVNLNTFQNSQTVPHLYPVKRLTTQYRSVPSIGTVFSKFAYQGNLKHSRSESSRRPLHIEDIISINALNIIKFPVSKYESIYRAKRLHHSSSYQIYSALFTFEFAVYLSELIAKRNRGDFFKIGIISPYRVQADLIERLLDSVVIVKEVEILVGTIHGFQGDECDIIFAVWNPPPVITSGKEMFLNKKNIINVSISRAKDYLFLIMPDNHTENIENLSLVKRTERLLKSSGFCTEFLSHDLEQQIFGNPYYLEENTFSTAHQSVNIYGRPEKCYEIRSEDLAVDIQIHREE